MGTQFAEVQDSFFALVDAAIVAAPAAFGVAAVGGVAIECFLQSCTPNLPLSVYS